MKKIAFLYTIFSCTTIYVNAQMRDNIMRVDQDNFAAKSKNQKTIAWLLAGGGTALAITGLATASNNLWEDIGEDHVRGEGIFYSGIVMAVASVPFFILSKKNAKKAALAFTNDRFYKISPGNLVYQDMPSIKLKINLH